MINHNSITGNKITLKELSPNDDLINYLKWMNDIEVNKFLESRLSNHTLASLRQYIRDSNNSEFEKLLGIFDNKSGYHIGNIKLSEINPIHNYAYIGIVIGLKSFWGKGLASEAINLMTRFSFDSLNLNKLIAGIYEDNIGSIKAFENAGFLKVGKLHRHRFYKGSYTDQYLLEIINYEK